MSLGVLATYRPAWDAGGGARACGPDEDVATLAVEAARRALAVADARPDRLVLVTREPDLLEGSTGAVVATALGLEPEATVEERLGGGPAALAALASAAPGTLVVAVSPAPPAGAAAALVDGSGAGVAAVAGVEGSLPARVRHAGAAAAQLYDDPRLLRERGWRRAVAAVTDGEAPAAVAGVRSGDLRRFGVEDAVDVAPVGGAAESLFALAALLAASRGGRLVAVEGASAFAADVTGYGTRVVHAERPPVPGPRPKEPIPAEIPLSLPAYARAFDAKVGFRGARCSCGALHFPPRSLCTECGRVDASTPEPLPRTGEVYTTTTIHTPIPGLPGPYSLAVVSLDGLDLRVLAHVTDAAAGAVRIGDRGELVLRCVAVREGVPDYGYAFAPDGDEPR